MFVRNCCFLFVPVLKDLKHKKTKTGIEKIYGLQKNEKRTTTNMEISKTKFLNVAGMRRTRAAGPEPDLAPREAESWELGGYPEILYF